MSFLSFLHKVANRENLTPAQSYQLMDLVLSGEASTPQLSAMLIALRMKGETADELTGFARAMRDRCVRVDAGNAAEPLVDTCGTGGDGACTFNISTISAFVIAGAGLRVAKHGNRSISSQCGSADILEALGVEIQLPPAAVAKCIREAGIGFLFAPSIHPAMRHAQAARSELKMRTAFNLLGPLTNPANANVQLAGAPTVRAAELMAESLACLGLQRGFVVHGSDGLDEITTTGETVVLEIRRGAIAHYSVSPSDFGVDVAKPEDLRGGDRDVNAALGLAVLAGERGPRRDIVLVNASAALFAAGKAANFVDGVAIAAEAIDSGAALRKLDELVETSRAAAELAAHGV